MGAQRDEWQDIWQVRGQIYAFLGNSLLNVPSAENTPCFTADFWEQFPLEAANEHLEHALASLKRTAEELEPLGSDAAVHAVAADYTQLFVGPGAPNAPLWESLYREGGKFLFGAPTFDMRQLMREHSMKLDESAHQFEDHLGVELLYLAKISERFAQETPGKSDVQEQLQFIDEHPLWWIERLQHNVASNAKLGYYPAFVELIWGVLLWDKELLAEF